MTSTTETAAPPPPAQRIRSPRMAGLVADKLRSQILSGELADGEHLPKEDLLRAQFGVGKPAMREAMRILEEEGLISIVRGNRGGAIVHLPTGKKIAYSLGLALTARQASARDVGRALREVEPICAALCARRADRLETLVPRLEELVAQAEAAVPDAVLTTALSRKFHEELVASCGNETLILMVGALEALWSSHVTTESAPTDGPVTSQRDSRASIEEHRRICGLIASGEDESVRLLLSRHIERVQSDPTAANATPMIDLSVLRT